MPNFPKRLTGKKLLPPGTVVHTGMAVIDHQHRVRTLPNSPQRRNAMLNSIMKRIEALKRLQHNELHEKLPHNIPHREMLKMLHELGFVEQRSKVGRRSFHHRTLRPISITYRTVSNINISRNPRLGKLYLEWLAFKSKKKK